MTKKRGRGRSVLYRITWEDYAAWFGLDRIPLRSLLMGSKVDPKDVYAVYELAMRLRVEEIRGGTSPGSARVAFRRPKRPGPSEGSSR